MSEYEPITGELREALDVDREFMRADGAVVAQTFCVDRGDFERLCDAIDAVHTGLERENAELRERVAVLDNQSESMHDGWVRLPLDADGVPWRIGDMTESGQTVEAMGLNMHGWHFVGTVNEIDPAIHRHHHAPTVEDVLREFADLVRKERVELATIGESTIANYAAKLRLAGDAS